MQDENEERTGKVQEDSSPGEVIVAWSDGMILLDDGVMACNPVRAQEFLQRQERKAIETPGLDKSFPL